MTSIKKILVAAASCVGLFGSAEAAEQTMKPLQGVSFHAGTKHAVAYYLDDDSHCKLVLTLAEEPRDSKANFEATRFEAAIAAGESTRYQFVEGASLEFTCHSEARAMKVRAQRTEILGAIEASIASQKSSLETIGGTIAAITPE
jgi:hypothetical protein